MLWTIILLVIANLFMTFAWYAHLKHLNHAPIYVAIFVSWGIALIEYFFQVPANRIGYHYFTLPQLKVMQEVITMAVFALYCILYMRVELSKNFFYAGVCLVMAVFFIMRDLKV